MPAVSTFALKEFEIFWNYVLHFGHQIAVFLCQKMYRDILLLNILFVKLLVMKKLKFQLQWYMQYGNVQIRLKHFGIAF